MRRIIVMLTTVLLLGSASVAAAECAWVLWMKYFPTTEEPIYWEVVDAKANQEDCIKTRDFMAERTPDFLKESVHLVCLPDTIDPREKKE